MSETLRFVIGLIILVAAGFMTSNIWKDWHHEQEMIENANLGLNEALRHPDTVQRLVGLAALRDDVAMIYRVRAGAYSMIVGSGTLPIEADINRSFDSNLQQCLGRERKTCPLRLASVMGQLIANPYQRDLAAIETAHIMIDAGQFDEAETVVNAIQDPMLQSYGFEIMAENWQGSDDNVQHVRDLWQKSLTALRNVPPGIDRVNSTSFMINVLLNQPDDTLKTPETLRPLVEAAIDGMADQPSELPTAMTWLQLIAATAPMQQPDLSQIMLDRINKVSLPEAAFIKLQAQAIMIPIRIKQAGTAPIRSELVALTSAPERMLLQSVLSQYSFAMDDHKLAKADLDQAIAAARIVPAPQMMPEMVIELVAAFSAQGYWDQANEMMGQLKPDTDAWREAGLEIARYQIVAGKKDDAAKWLEKLPPDSVQAVRLRTLIEKPDIAQSGSNLAQRVRGYFQRAWLVNAKAQEEIWQKRGLYRPTRVFADAADKLAEAIRVASAPAAQSDNRPSVAIDNQMRDLVAQTLLISDMGGTIRMQDALAQICPQQNPDCPVDHHYLQAWIMRRIVLPVLMKNDLPLARDNPA